MRGATVPFAFSLVLFLSCGSAPAQKPDAADPFRPADIASVIAEHDLTRHLATLREGDQVYMPPHFRYRLTLKASGAIRPLSEKHRRALERWAKAHRAEDFIEHFTHEIEVSQGDTSFWLPWQRVLVAPFEDELRAGGTMSVRVLLAGALAKEVLFVAIGYQLL